MRDTPAITLRYFNARGRAQFLRAYLTARDIAFADERITIDDFSVWRSIRPDRTISGPLQRLPVLKIGDDLIAETLVIAAFLHRHSGDAALLGDEDNRRHETILSLAYTDIMLPIGTLIWAEMLFPGVDLTVVAANMRDRLDATLAALDQTLRDWRWVERLDDRPVTIADCLLWEELDQVRTVFGDHLRLDDKSSLATIWRDYPSRAVFEQNLAAHRCQITGRPGEPDTIASIRRALDQR